jgi:hypothetical protein
MAEEKRAPGREEVELERDEQEQQDEVERAGLDRDNAAEGTRKEPESEEELEEVEESKNVA